MRLIRYKWGTDIFLQLRARGRVLNLTYAYLYPTLVAVQLLQRTGLLELGYL